MSSGSRKLSLRSSDGQAFEIDEKVAVKSQTLKNMVDDDCADSVIPLPNVTGSILSLVIEYCQMHVDSPPPTQTGAPFSAPDRNLTDWDKKFISKHDRATLFHLILAANYLDIKGLFDLGCKTLAKQMEGKSVEELRKMFNIGAYSTSDREQ